MNNGEHDSTRTRAVQALVNERLIPLAVELGMVWEKGSTFFLERPAYDEDGRTALTSWVLYERTSDGERWCPMFMNSSSAAGHRNATAMAYFRGVVDSLIGMRTLAEERARRERR